LQIGNFIFLVKEERFFILSTNLNGRFLRSGKSHDDLGERVEKTSKV